MARKIWRKNLQLGDGMSYDSLGVVLRQYAENFVMALLVALILRFFVISAYQVSGSEMLPNLQSGDFILAYKLPYGWPIPFSQGQRLGWHPPHRGELVIMHHPQSKKTLYARRVIALPGDRVEIRNHRLYVNNVPALYRKVDERRVRPATPAPTILRESLLGTVHEVVRSQSSQAGHFSPQVVPPGHVFVLSDRRDSPEDSRTWGMIPETHMVGRVLGIWLSMDWQRRDSQTGWPTVRWQRVFRAVD